MFDLSLQLGNGVFLYTNRRWLMTPTLFNLKIKLKWVGFFYW